MSSNPDSPEKSDARLRRFERLTQIPMLALAVVFLVVLVLPIIDVRLTAVSAGCGSAVLGGSVFVSGDDQKALHERVAKRRGSTVEFIRWFDSTDDPARTLVAEPIRPSTRKVAGFGALSGAGTVRLVCLGRRPSGRCQ